MLPQTLLPSDIHLYLSAEPIVATPCTPIAEPTAAEPPTPRAEPTAAESPPQIAAPPIASPSDELAALSRADLRARCERLGIARAGSKSQLIARLVAVS